MKYKRKLMSGMVGLAFVAGASGFSSDYINVSKFNQAKNQVHMRGSRSDEDKSTELDQPHCMRLLP